MEINLGARNVNDVIQSMRTPPVEIKSVILRVNRFAIYVYFAIAREEWQL